MFDPLITSARYKPTTYLHGEHPAMTVAMPFARGDVMNSERVLWPEARPGDKILCGTCGESFLNPVGPLPVAAEAHLP